MAESGIRVQGLREFRTALRRVQGSYPRQLSVGLKAAGEPFVRHASGITPQRSGRLAGGWRTSVAGIQGSIVSTVPYSGGAVWGQRGKWVGFAKYGATPRFVGPALDAQEDAAAEILLQHLRDLVTIGGWASGW